MVGIAVILSLITSVLVYNYLQAVTNKTTKDEQPVVIAKTDIPANTIVTADMVEITYVPSDYIQPGALQDIKTVVGSMSSEYIIAGEQVLSRRMLLEGKTRGFTGLIPAGKRAVTIPVTEVTGVASFIKPGDYVDVMVTFDQSTAGDYMGDVILQNLLVLAVNHDAVGNGSQDKDKKDPIKTATVTLAIDPADVHHLAVGDDRGKIRLALRPYLPEEGFVLTKAISARELMGKPELQEKAVQPENHSENQPETYRHSSRSIEVSSYSNNNDIKATHNENNGITIIRGTKAEDVQVN